MIHRAFTLAETIVVVALTSIASIALGSLLVFLYKTDAYVYAQATATNAARHSLSDVSRYAREAARGSDGSDAVQSAATSTVTFLSDTNNDQALERVTYALTGKTFTRTIAGAVTTLATSVVNGTSTPTFRYFNAAGGELTPPLTTSQVASIEATLVVQVDAVRGPAAFRLSERATLRNAGL